MFAALGIAMDFALKKNNARYLTHLLDRVTHVVSPLQKTSGLPLRALMQVLVPLLN